METLYENSDTGCCKRFDPEPWDEKEIILDQRLFIKDTIFCLFNIPMNFGKVMTKNMEKIKQADACIDDPLFLYKEKSRFKADLYIAVSKEVPNSDMETISGTFLTKVFEGDFSHTGGWIKKMDDFVKSKNKAMKNMYFFYTTCPKCAKVYGKNYTVILAEI